MVEVQYKNSKAIWTSFITVIVVSIICMKQTVSPFHDLPALNVVSYYFSCALYSSTLIFPKILPYSRCNILVTDVQDFEMMHFLITTLYFLFINIMSVPFNTDIGWVTEIQLVDRVQHSKLFYENDVGFQYDRHHIWRIILLLIYMFHLLLKNLIVSSDFNITIKKVVIHLNC